MNALTEIANVLTTKDEAIVKAIHFLSKHVVPCDMNPEKDEDHECQMGSGHWYWCPKGKIGILINELNEAFKTR